MDLHSIHVLDCLLFVNKHRNHLSTVMVLPWDEENFRRINDDLLIDLN